MKKIGMILFNYPLGVSPSLINSAILLSQEGYEVHIFINRSSFEESKIEFPDENVVIHDIGYKTEVLNKKITILHQGRLKKIPVGKVLWSSYSILMSMLHRIKLLHNVDADSSFSEKLHRCTTFFFRNLYEFYRNILDYVDDDYVCIFGVDANGLIAATLIAESFQRKRIPVIYYNLELLLEKECNSTIKKILKSLERECNKKSFLTVIPDRRRAKYLMEDNEIPEEKIVQVPVSVLGDIYQNKSDYLHRTLNIPKNKKIVLYAGNIISWAMCLEIAEAAQKWNDDKVLVLHTWMTDLDNIPYVNQIRNLTKNKKVYLSLNPVKWESLPELLSSADIGLVFYQNIGKNFYETGSSSNKLAQYLQVGLPVITSDYPSFREVIEKYKCGKCTNNPEEIEKLAREILRNYDF